MTSGSLTVEEVERWRRGGVIVLREAFPRAVAIEIQERIWEHLARACQVDRDDPATWYRQPWRGSSRLETDPLVGAVASPRLTAAIDQLLGRGGWSFPKRIISLSLVHPPAADRSGPWTVVADGWHWDGHWRPDEMGTYYCPIFAPLPHRGGGTFLLEGSRPLLDGFYTRLSPQQRRGSQKSLRERFLSSHPYLRRLTGIDPEPDRARFLRPESDEAGHELRVVEIAGEPGDVVLTRSFALHAKPMQHGDRPRMFSIRGIGPAF